MRPRSRYATALFLFALFRFPSTEGMDSAARAARAGKSVRVSRKANNAAVATYGGQFGEISASSSSNVVLGFHEHPPYHSTHVPFESGESLSQREEEERKGDYHSIVTEFSKLKMQHIIESALSTRDLSQDLRSYTLELSDQWQNLRNYGSLRNPGRVQKIVSALEKDVKFMNKKKTEIVLEIKMIYGIGTYLGNPFVKQTLAQLLHHFKDAGNDTPREIFRYIQVAYYKLPTWQQGDTCDSGVVHFELLKEARASLKISDAELELWSPEFINEQLTKIKKALSPPVFNSPQGPIRAFVPKQVVGAAKDTFFKIFRQAMRGDPRAERAVEKLAEKFPQNYEFGHFGEYQQQEYLKRLITSGPRYILSKAEVEFALSNRKVKFLSFIFNSDFEDWSGAFASCEDEEVKKLYAVFSTHIDDPRDERLKPIQEWAAKAILPERSQSVSNEAFCFALHTLYDGAVLAHHAKSNENPCFLALLEAKGAYHNQRSFDSASLEMLRTIFNGVMRSN